MWEGLTFKEKMKVWLLIIRLGISVISLMAGFVLLVVTLLVQDDPEPGLIVLYTTMIITPLTYWLS